MRVKVSHGDSREVLKTLENCSVASVVTDPPYSLVSITKRFGKDAGRKEPSKPGKKGVYHRASKGFMGQTWDTGETAFDPEFWAEVLRVLKPGGHVLAFGGTRTYHRLVCAIEDAGFEVRDSIGWLFGSGFPKSHNVAKGIDKAAGRPIEVVPTGKPVKRMIPDADQNKDGGWEKTNGREYQPGEYMPSEEAAPWSGWGTALKPAMELICVARKPIESTVAGNVLAHGTGALNIDGCRIETADKVVTIQGQSASQQDGTMYSGRDQRDKRRYEMPSQGRWPANVMHDGSEEATGGFPMQTSGGTPPNRPGHKTLNTYGVFGGQENPNGIGSTAGNASRFFYSAKADADDRLGSKHPTVKPVDLMRWLVRLVTPPGGIVLDPFAGSGTTLEAATLEGMRCIGIEQSADYLSLIAERLRRVGLVSR